MRQLKRRKIFVQKRLKTTLKVVALSILSGVLLVILTLIRPSFPILDDAEKTLTSWLMFTKTYIFSDYQSEPFVFIDVSNDNILHTGEDGKQHLLTDRKKLTELLTTLGQHSDRIKFVLCDLLLEDSTNADTQLLSSINKLPNKVLFTKGVDEHGIIRQPRYSIPAAVAVYDDINGSFLTYPLYYDQEPTAPLVMFQRMHKASVDLDSSWLDRFVLKVNKEYHSTYPTIDLRINNSDVLPSPNGTSYLYYELGSLISLLKSIQLSQFLPYKQNVIIIGGLAAENNTDMHSSLLQDVSGPLTIINTYLMLRERETRIKISWLIFILICYSFISYNVLCRNLFHRFSVYTYTLKSNNWVINKVFESIKKYILVDVVLQLLLVSIASYAFFHKHIEIVLLSIIFSFIIWVNKLYIWYKSVKS